MADRRPGVLGVIDAQGGRDHRLRESTHDPLGSRTGKARRRVPLLPDEEAQGLLEEAAIRGDVHAAGNLDRHGGGEGLAEARGRRVLRREEVAEAEANIASLQREAEHLKNAITLEVEEAHMNAVTAQNQITLFEEEIITQAEEVYNMFLFSYQEGEIGSIELIEARRTLLEARKSYADALYNHGVALAALEKSIGLTFEGESQ